MRRRALAALSLALSVVAGPLRAQADPLPSWNEGETRQRILDFVAAVTDRSGDRYVAPEERIAVFDNDGTLWVEKPTYTQVFFVLERLKALAPDHPEWKTEQPFASALAGELGGLGVRDVLKLAAATHSGMSQEVFDAEAEAFFESARHPRWKRPFQELIYQPQLELIAHLRASGFKVFIVTGGGRDFVRAVSQPIYGVPPEAVIGSGLQTRFEMRDGRPRLLRLPELAEPFNDRAGKPVNIEREIGGVPVIAVGNSDGDLEMLQYSTARGARSLQILLHHDDAEREYDYDQGTEKALAEADASGWVIARIERDFRRVFPFDP